MNILLTGATGALGREVLELLKQQRHHVRILTRSDSRARAFAAAADERVIGDALIPAQIQGICEDMDVVISCLGAPVSMSSREKRSYLKVDVPANLNLLAEARKSGVHRFIYVSLWIQPEYRANGYVEAHLQVERALRDSGLSYTIVRPTGLFSAMEEFLSMAKGGVGMLPGGGKARTNPVHDADVAEAMMGILINGPEELAIGGPDVLSRKEILDMAFASLGKAPRYLNLSAKALGTMASLLRPFDARSSDIMRFFAQAASTDAIAPQIGSLHLKDYFEIKSHF